MKFERLCGIILLAFLRNFELTSAILVSQSLLDKMLSILISQSVVFENHEYDRKVINYCFIVPHIFQ